MIAESIGLAYHQYDETGGWYQIIQTSTGYSLGHKGYVLRLQGQPISRVRDFIKGIANFTDWNTFHLIPKDSDEGKLLEQNVYETFKAVYKYPPW